MSKIGDGVRRRLDRAARDLETRNPEAVFEAALQRGQEQLAELKRRAAGLVQQRNTLSERSEAAERDLARLAQALHGALEEGDDDTALVLTARRTELVAEQEARAAEHAEAAGAVEEAKRNLVDVRASLEALKRERDTALAQLAAAEAAIEIDETHSGVSDRPQARALDSVRTAIGGLERRAHAGWLDEDGESVRGRAAALGRKAAEQSAREQLEALKAARPGPDDPDEDSHSDG